MCFPFISGGYATNLGRILPLQLEPALIQIKLTPSHSTYKRGTQRGLADEAEELARELDRLARETGDQQLAETARDLQEAADAMRRSAAQSGSNTGTAEANAALDQIEEAERRLERAPWARSSEARSRKTGR